MDALSEALNSVRMTGAFFCDAICTTPWGFVEPAMDKVLEKVSHQLAPGTERVVGYHLFTKGQGLIRLDGEADVPVAAGDIVVIPHGDQHMISNGSPASLGDGMDAIAEGLAGKLTTCQVGGGGELTHIVCGYFGCERHAARLFLGGLPPIIKINIRGDVAGEWLERSILHLLRVCSSGAPGRKVLLSKMAEALFIETLRRYMQHLPPEQSGWLAGARDPVVGAVLALLHRKPRHPWTAAELAEEIGASRSIIAERFARFLGEPPLTYLARWRLQLAARKLQTTQDTVLQVASEVGYESEAAFNRAFKREFGLPPARFRRKLLGEKEAFSG